MSATEAKTKRSALEESYYAAGYWRSEDLWTTIFNTAMRDPDRTALIYDDKATSFRELIDGAVRVGRGLAARGIGAGDVVIIHARHSIEAAHALLACAWLGAVTTPMPSMFSESQLATVASSAKAKVVFGLGESSDEIKRAIAGARTIASVETIVVPDDFADGTTTLAWSSLAGADSGRPRTPVDADALAMLAYSSGTTGHPKGIMHSSNTLRYAVEQRALMHGITAKDACLVVLPFGLAGGTVFGLLSGLVMGTTTVFMRTWDAERAIHAIETHKISYAHFYPAHVHDLLASPALDRADVSSLWRASMAGLTRERWLETKKRLCPKPLPSYGLSECMGNTTCPLDDTDERMLTKAGRPYPGTEMLVLDDDGKPAAADVIGAILIRGPSRFLGYYGAPELTRQALTEDGYFRTGDVGALDADGYFTFTSREKDIIRRGGVTIVPGDIEAALLAHPAIAQVAVVGLPDERLGERACACIIARDGHPIMLETVTGFLESRGFARYLWPERVAMFDSFPLTPTLKVQKRGLVEQLTRKDGEA